MSSQSQQKKVGRVRPPRVQILYEVETGGAMKKVELPFVVGVLADLSGQPQVELPGLKDRKFAFIDRDNFNDVMKKAGPGLAVRVQNKLTDEDTKLAVKLKFEHIDDFEPARVAEQIEPLANLLRQRKDLKELLAKMEGKDKVVKLLDEIIGDQEKRAAITKQLEGEGAKTETPETEKPK